MKKLLLLLIALIGVTSSVCAQGLGGKTTIYIVRHGEKDASDPKNPDPQLSTDGLNRSKALASELKNEKLSAVFSTKYKRTTVTGSPAAEMNNLTVLFYNPADPKALAELIKAQYKGQKVLIVGHSNTVLELAEAFGVKRPLPALADEDYDFLFKVEVDETGYSTLTTGNYGKTHRTSEIKQ